MVRLRNELFSCRVGFKTFAQSVSQP